MKTKSHTSSQRNKEADGNAACDTKGLVVKPWKGLGVKNQYGRRGSTSREGRALRHLGPALLGSRVACERNKVIRKSPDMTERDRWRLPGLVRLASAVWRWRRQHCQRVEGKDVSALLLVMIKVWKAAGILLWSCIDGKYSGLPVKAMQKTGKREWSFG